MDRRHVALARTTVMAASGMAPRDQGLVGGGVNTTRQVGAALGVAVLVAIAGADPHAGVAAVGGERAAMFVAAMAGLVAATELGRGSGSDVSAARDRLGGSEATCSGASVVTGVAAAPELGCRLGEGEVLVD